MNRTTTLPTTRNEEVALGWNAMPAYGEVMNQIVGTSQTNVVSSLQIGNSFTITSIWNVLSNLR